MDEIPLKNESPVPLETGRKSDAQSDEFHKYITSSSGEFQVNPPKFNRPGISDETLIKAGISRVTAEEAQKLCGFAAAGIWIQYFDIDGKPIVSNGRPYGRLRLDKPYEVPA